MDSLEDWLQREQMERRISDSLLKWLGFDKPSEQRVIDTTEGVEGAAD